MTDAACYLAASRLLAEQSAVGHGLWVSSLALPFEVIFDDTEHYASVCGCPVPARGEGVCVRSGGRYVILYSPGWDIPRVNYTLAHELGHIILGHTGEGDEREANAFACALLVHGAPLREIVARFGADPAVVSRFFGVSKSCAAAALSREDVRTGYDEKILSLYSGRLARLGKKNPLDIPFTI